MKEDLTTYKNQLAQYLAGKGVEFDDKTGNYRCIAPDHLDSNPSMTFYASKNGSAGNYVNCNSCDFSGDIFDCAGILTGSGKFIDQLEDIKKTLGMSETPINDYINSQVPKKSQPARQKTKYVPLTREEAKKIYTDEAVLNLANMILNYKIAPDSEKYKKLEITEMYPYYNADKMIDIMVVRFEHGEDKTVLTMYYTGRILKAKGYPVLLYSRDKLAEFPDMPVIVHEGEKCCNYGSAKMPDFIHTTWNGGAKKVPQIQELEILKDRDVYLWPDDDHKIDKQTKKEFPPEKQPGLKAMIELKKRLEELT